MDMPREVDEFNEQYRKEPEIPKVDPSQLIPLQIALIEGAIKIVGMPCPIKNDNAVHKAAEQFLIEQFSLFYGTELIEVRDCPQHDVTTYDQEDDPQTMKPCNEEF